MRNQLLYITSHKLSDNNGGANCSKFFVNAFAKLFDDCSIIFPAFDEPHAVIPSKYKQYPCFDKRCKIKKGMILSTVSSMLMQNSRVRGLPGISMEDLRNRLSEDEVSSIKRWAEGRNIATISIVKKIPFAVFLAMGFACYFAIWSAFRWK